jgi:hypothetical protein
VTVAELRGDIVILACAVSAGIHGALVRDHFEEGAGAGIGFIVATVLLALLAVALTRNASQLVLLAAIAVLGGLIVSYVLVVATGLPVLHREREAVDALALFTKAVECLGLVTAATLLTRPSRALAIPRPKGTLA